MKGKLVNYCIVTVLIAGISGCNSQSPDIGEEFAALKQNQEKMQKDLDEIKKWVADHTPPKPKPFQPSPAR